MRRGWKGDLSIWFFEYSSIERIFNRSNVDLFSSASLYFDESIRKILRENQSVWSYLTWKNFRLTGYLTLIFFSINRENIYIMLLNISELSLFLINLITIVCWAVENLRNSQNDHVKMIINISFWQTFPRIIIQSIVFLRWSAIDYNEINIQLKSTVINEVFPTDIGRITVERNAFYYWWAPNQY